MAATLSPNRTGRSRRLSVDAEDELFKSLKELQEQNSSFRVNNSGRTGRRSVDVTRTASPGTHSARKGRRSIDVTRAASPGAYKDRAQSPGAYRAQSPGAYNARRQQRRASLTNSGRKSVNKGADSPKRNSSAPRRNNSGRRKMRSFTPPPNAVEGDATMPQAPNLNRQCSGGSLRKPRNRRASTGTEDAPIIPKGRTGRRSTPNAAANAAPETPGREKGRTKIRSLSPKAATGASSPVRRSLYRRRTSTSPNESPPHKGDSNNGSNMNNSQEFSEMTMRSNLLKNAKPLRLDNSTASWASFDASFDDDIDNSDLELSKSEFNFNSNKSDRSDFTKPTSDRTTHSDRPENSDLKNLLEKLRDPAELERWKEQKETLSPKKATTQTGLEHDKVTEKASAKLNLKNFLQRSKRGYGQQSNFDGLSVME
ncbi:MAG: hypothetical protein SGBAC_007518 [Bacillariaceae sp.]